jgi:dipeptidyl aminopeptidase/acylaminoacyl peptidase
LEAPVPTGEIFGVDADGGQNDALFGYRVATREGTHLNVAKREQASAYVVSELREDDDKVIIAVRTWNDGGEPTMPELRRMNVRDGKTVPLFTSPLREPSGFLADNHGNVRFAYGEDANGSWQVFYRGVDAKSWESLPNEQRAYPVEFSRDDATVYWACAKEGAVGALCTWSPKERKLVPVWSDKAVAMDDLVYSLDGLDVVGVRSMPGRVSVGLLDKKSDAIQLLSALMPQFPGDDVRIISTTHDGKKAVLLVASDVNPGEYHLYDAATKKLNFLMQRWPGLKPEQLAPMEPIELKARDGIALRGYLTRPPGKAEAKNLPMVVLVHGGPYGVHDDWNFNSETQLLASRGYAVLQVNFRGSGGRNHEFEVAGYLEWGGKMQDDVTDATRWAVEQGIADAKRLCIYGASYGGYAALEGATKEPDLYRCAIGDAGVYDLRAFAHGGTDFAKSTSGDNYLERVLGKDDAVLSQRSPVANAEKIKAKVMLIVGGADKRVPPEQGMGLHMALDKLKVAHEYLYERTEGHGYYDEAHRVAMYEKLLQFLDKNIGAAAGGGDASSKASAH